MIFTGKSRHVASSHKTFTRLLLSYKNIITIDLDKHGGQPCVRGLRITVGDVLGYLAAGMSHQEILTDFPELTLEDIRACLEFASDREKRISCRPAG
jgi:uncharacterized protein (DUF433 family)